MIARSAARRAALALIGIALSAFALRPQIATALIGRGDEMLYRGDPAGALRYYRRALRFDSADAAALDRFLFTAVRSGNAAAIEEGIGAATRYVRRLPNDAILFDRALAYRQLRWWKPALADFRAYGIRRHDAASLTLAGFAASRLHERRVAIDLWRQAVADDPALPVALHALQRAGVRP